MNHEKETGASLEFLVPRDLADGVVNHKRESYKFRYIHLHRCLLQRINKNTYLLVFVNDTWEGKACLFI